MKLIAYCLTENLGVMQQEDIEVLDSIHIAFGLIKEGEVFWDEEQGKQDIERIRSMRKGIRLVLSIGGWEADGFSQAAATEEARKKWAASVVSLVENYGFDGIDIDWEYPCSDKAGIKASPADKDNFTLLLREMREQLDGFLNYKSLSIAAGALKSYLMDTNMKEVSELLDYVQLMTYDLCGGWDAVTGHHAALYPYKAGAANSDEIIRLFAGAGVPMEKIVMGAAFYSREWRGAADENPGSPVKGEAPSRSYGEIHTLCTNPSLGYKEYWDDRAKAAYLYNGDIFVSYENEAALAYKAKYVKESGMYGMMFWEYGQDTTCTLTKFLHRQLNHQ